MDDRSKIVEQLKVDLIGPRDPLEKIDERPSDRYLLGMLFPQKQKIKSEDDENIGQDGASSEDDEDDSAISAYQSFKPSTAGISFSVSGKEPSYDLQINFSCALYEQKEVSEGTNALAQETAQKPIWERKPIDGSIKINVSSDTTKKDLSEHHLPWIELFIVRRYLKDKTSFTLQIINKFEGDGDTPYSQFEERTIFQVALSVQTLGPNAFCARSLSAASSDEDTAISNLIYREFCEYATGHNCAAIWSDPDGDGPEKIELSWLPSVEVKPVNPKGDPLLGKKITDTETGELCAKAIYSAPKEQVFELLWALVDGYDDWIGATELRAKKLDAEFALAAAQNLKNCSEAKNRIAEAISLLETNDDAFTSFRLANQAMFIQSAWAKGYSDHEEPLAHRLIWRPFQLAFALMTIPSIVHREHPDRKVFDLVWFPTGGGKTEAYLLSAAFTLFHRRLTNPSDLASGLSVIMRYTLRTLTVQQFQRAASMVTACEFIRRSEKHKKLGNERFSIGLWVGDKTSPNKLKNAIDALHDPYSISTPRQLTKCPRCPNANLIWEADSLKSSIQVKCDRDACEAHDRLPYIPVVTVDEEIYANPPSMLIATVDKFAQVTTQEKTAELFGAGKRLPPDLIIQDELHLISGPLGSITGLYEIAIEELCRHKKHPVKIIGSTATIRKAEEQVRTLYDRYSFQFPPPGIDEGNSGFASKDDDAEGRLYIGLSTSGRSPKYVLQAASASLLQTGTSDKISEKAKKYYGTLVAYFNSLKELGGALVVMQDDVPKTMQSLAKVNDMALRAIGLPQELTSRRPSSEIPELLDQLETPPNETGFVDVLLATNMLSVGVDISRLGMMLVHGQPKSIAEYIQATSRVGRSFPGIVVTMFNHNKIRDRAYYETFTTWHSTLYRAVEANSATPFAPRARDKALHAPFVAIARHLLGVSSPTLDGRQFSQMKKELTDILGKRVEAIDADEKEDALDELDNFLQNWFDREKLSYFLNDKSPSKSLMISAEAHAKREALGGGASPAKPTPMSVRNVEPSVTFRLQRPSRKH